MSKHGLVGSGSLMPESMYLKKMEQTCIYEDEEQLNNHYRNTLKDRRPDKPFFESDATRYNNYSKDRLNLRHSGQRNNIEPYIADGEFLDYDMLSKDPRGIILEPNMMKYRSQKESRNRFIKHGNDEDLSIPTAVWNPYNVLKDTKEQFYNTKNRIKIFDESMDARHNGGTANKHLTSTGACLQETDERHPIIQDAMCYNRTNIINDLSNNTSIGWRRTTDHVFKIAKYGQLRPNAPLSQQDWSKNRANAVLDHDVLLSWKDHNVPKSLSLKMIDLAQKRYEDIEAGNNVAFDQSKKSQMRTKRLSPADLFEAFSSTEETRADNANETLKAERINKKGSVPTFDTNYKSKTVVDPFIVESITTISRKMGKREMDDLREQIEQSGEEYNILVEQKNKAPNINDTPKNKLLWEAEANYEKGKSMKVANYSKIASNTFINARNQDGAEYESFKRASKPTVERKGKFISDMYNMEVVRYDNKYGEEVDAVKQTGPMKSKYVRHLIDGENSSTPNMGDITAVNAR